MHITTVTETLNLGDKVNKQTNHVFVFLEIFAHEGGIQSYIKDIFRAYLGLSQGYKAEVFLLRDSPDSLNPFEDENLKFHYFKNQSPYLGRLQMAAALLKCLLQSRPQQVFCGHINLAVLIQTLCQPLGIPYTVLTYGKEVWEPLKNQERRALTSAAGIWTISRYSRDRACVANSLNPKMVQMMPCAIDGDKFTPGSKQPELVQKYGLTGAKVLMTVARLWSGDIYKGVDVTIRALPQIAQVFPEVKYLVIGRGDDQPRLAQLAKDLGVSDRVVFAGFVATEELIEHYRLADAYIMPSQEGFGIVYLEAMACGVPVLSGDDDGSADPLQDGKLGWRVPHRNPVAVAAACIYMLQGDDQRCDRKWLREQAIALFGIDAFQQHLQKMLLSPVMKSI
ncbi:glycosyltransferase family 4 protein [Nostoc flagelliforme FACHB-838]|uniref:Glycosyltransferase family 4 protein n=1 Tax=Nostoc flagelliforme FACHB-838 TaxID=2692904 RepID=A0ABR8DKJ8_9NOSO|nr:glycosyltransferase family 4 protein [Nostoc flagelliforme]MBD2529466.1 glycosyltransferase family 4 protein [Nostoc flagelliforme FACHB-838]